MFVVVILVCCNCVCISVHAQSSSKLEVSLQKVLDEKDPEDLITIGIWLYSEVKPISSMPSWPNREKAIAEHNALLAAEEQDFIDSIPKDVEFELQMTVRVAPLVFLKTKVKDVMKIVEMENVVSIGYDNTEVIDLSEPKGVSLKELFAWWIEFSKFQPNYDEKSFDEYTKYQEIYYGDGWTLIYGIYPDCPVPWEQEYRMEINGRIISGIIGASNKDVAYPYTVYDEHSEAFFSIANVSVDEYEGLAKALTELKIGRPIGDADNDNELTILDATRIQRVLAELENVKDEDEYYYLSVAGAPRRFSDYDEDGDVTVLDATAIQRHLARLS